MRNSRNTYKYAGTIQTVTADGEMEKAVIVRQKKQDLNFVKIFLPERGYHMYPKKMISSARAVMDYLVVVCEKNNNAIAPTSEIVERIGLSESSVCRGRKQLLEMDFVRMRSQSVYMLNPAKFCKVDADKRYELYDAYDSLKKSE